MNLATPNGPQLPPSTPFKRALRFHNFYRKAVGDPVFEIILSVGLRGKKSLRSIREELNLTDSELRNKCSAWEDAGLILLVSEPGKKVEYAPNMEAIYAIGAIQEICAESVICNPKDLLLFFSEEFSHLYISQRIVPWETILEGHPKPVYFKHQIWKKAQAVGFFENTKDGLKCNINPKAVQQIYEICKTL
jgi:hypothetical protein